MDHGLRRVRLAERLGELEIDGFLVTAAPNVRYLTGFTGTNGWLLLSPSGNVFLTDGRYEEQSRHEVRDLDIVASKTGLLEPLVAHATRLRVHRLGFEATRVSVRLYEQLASKAGDIGLLPVGEEVERLRWAKDADELARIQRAQEFTDMGFDAALGFLAEGMTEREAALELELAMRRAGADGVAFPPIVAFGEDSAEPHHRAGDRSLRSGDVVKLDFGALFDGYHSDMTRTVAFGEPPDELRDIHAVVRRAQMGGIAVLRAGTAASEPDRASRAPIEEAGYADRYTHPVGHGVGLEVHEGPGLRGSSTDLLPAGAVVTVEPGVYVPGLGGVRIEDMVLVTEDGGRVLPRSTKELVVL